MNIRTFILSALLGALLPAGAAAQFINHGKPSKFLETDIHILAGASGVTQNYRGTFPEITEFSSSMSGAYGFGAGAVFGIRNWLGFGTEINIEFNRNKYNMMAANSTSTSVSNIFIENKYVYADIPVYMSFRFNILSGLRWNVDTGIYYRYGLGGHQKQDIYNSYLNSLGQLVPTIINSKPPYFRDEATFLNSYYRSDWGLHIATGLMFGRHITIGIRGQIGFKNIAYNKGVNCPNIHNLSFLASLGYKF